MGLMGPMGPMGTMGTMGTMDPQLPSPGVADMPTRTPGALFSRSWPPGGAPAGHLIIVHGYAEHSGRYEALAGDFSAAGLHVHALDHRGHGHSPGTRGAIPSFSALVADLASFVEQVQRTADGKPVYLLGHSMGGLVTAHYLASAPSGICGAVFSSPLMAIPSHVSPLLLIVSRLLSALTPNLPVERLDSAGVARDAEVVRAYDADPLIYHDPIRARTGASLARAIQALDGLLPKITVPMLVFHGAADRIAPISGSQRLFDAAGSADKECYFVEGGFHELLNDTGREDVIHKVRDWIERHGVKD